MPRKRSAKPKEEPEPSTKRASGSQEMLKWFLFPLVAITVLSVATAIYSTDMLRTLTANLSDREGDLQQIDKEVSESIDEWFSNFESYLVKLARQGQPTRNNFSSMLDYKRVFTRFANNRYNVKTFPTRIAAAQYRLGQLHVLGGNNHAAIESLQASIALAEQHEFHEQVALSRNTLGCVYTALGQTELASEQFASALKLSKGSPISVNSVSVFFRNNGLLKHVNGEDGAPSIQESIRLLSGSIKERELSVSRELLIDSYMSLCEVLWAHAKITLATDACRQARQHLQTLLVQVQKSDLDTSFAATNRYLNAVRFAERNLKALRRFTNASDVESRKQNSVEAFQWQPLVSLPSEIVPEGVLLNATMHGEFEEQSGLVIAWGMFDWTHEVVTEVVRLVHDRVQLVILVDNDESLAEARSTIESVGVPVEGIRFSVCNYESPWFRDMGPLVGKTAMGNWLWFDSWQTRADGKHREVTDALPRIIRRNWNARVLPTPLHVEGGAILSNGNGLTICSSKMVTDNYIYGFDDNAILLELKRIVGPRTPAFLQPLIGEKTGHVDMFATFTDSKTLVVGQPSDVDDRNRKLLDAHATTLAHSGQEMGLRVERIPMPSTSGEVFRTYTNVVYANGLLLVPSYAHELDAEARDVYQRLLPDWRIEMIDCSELARRGGALHCLVSNLGGTPYTPMPVRLRARVLDE